MSDNINDFSVNLHQDKRQKQKHYWNIVILLLFGIFSGLIGYLIGINIQNKNLVQTTSTTSAQIYSREELDSLVNGGIYDYDLYRQIVANLKASYAGEIDDKKLFEGSLKGLVDALGDPATVYMTEKEYADFLDSLSGSFEGIGVRLEKKDNKVFVVEVLKDSPAQRVGIKTGLFFVKVNDEVVENQELHVIVSKVRGPKGSTVKVVLRDLVDGKDYEYSVVRDSIDTPSMEVIKINDDTALFKIYRFSDSTLQEWKDNWDKSVSELSHYEKIIIDVRGNGGGFLEAAVYASGDFLESDKIVLYEKGKSTNTPDEIVPSQRKYRLANKKVAILADQYTASAAEIFIGALRHHKGYKIIGVKTFGKGTVQDVIDLPGNNGYLKVTIKYWLLPNGKKLDSENSIVPDIEEKLNTDSINGNYDNQVNQAIGLL